MSTTAQSFQGEVESLSIRFKTELQALVNRHAASTLAGALPAPVPAHSTASVAPKAPSIAPAVPPVGTLKGTSLRKPAAKAATKAATKAPAAPKKTAATKGQKRSLEEMEKLLTAIHNHVKANSGTRVEPMSKALNTPTKDLSLPLKKLVAAGKIQVVGEKRATEYHFVA